MDTKPFELMAHIQSRSKLELVEDKGDKLPTADSPSGHQHASVVQDGHLHEEGGHLGTQHNTRINLKKKKKTIKEIVVIEAFNCVFWYLWRTSNLLFELSNFTSVFPNTL